MYEDIVKFGKGVAISESCRLAGLSKRRQLTQELVALATEPVSFEFPLEWEERLRHTYDGFGTYIHVEVCNAAGEGYEVYVNIRNCTDHILNLPLRTSQIAMLELHAIERSVELLRSTQKKG